MRVHSPIHHCCQPEHKDQSPDPRVGRWTDPVDLWRAQKIGFPFRSGQMISANELEREIFHSRVEGSDLWHPSDQEALAEG